jgi:hypothetical protein
VPVSFVEYYKHLTCRYGSNAELERMRRVQWSLVYELATDVDTARRHELALAAVGIVAPTSEEPAAAVQAGERSIRGSLG